MDSFPRQVARTRRFTLGQARNLTVAPDGSRVVFLRSPGPEDPLTGLWCYDTATGRERLVVDPGRLDRLDLDQLPPEERARRERSRELAGGIVGYATDREVTAAVFTLGGQLFRTGLTAAAPDGSDDSEGFGGLDGLERVQGATGVIDPRLDPTGTWVAWAANRGLFVAPAGPGGSAGPPARTRLAGEDDPLVTWGQAEFVAAEEMGRSRGYWWAPDGRSLLATRVDVSPVRTWWIGDPSRPEREPAPVRYPAAGTADAEVTCWLLGLDGTRRQIRWNDRHFCYLVVVNWSSEGPPLLRVESRDHREVQILTVDVATGTTNVVAEERDECWVDLTPGTPAWLDGGRLVRTTQRDDTCRLVVGEEVVTPAGLQVRRVEHVAGEVIFTASADPTDTQVWRWHPADGLSELSGEPGWHGASAGGPVVVLGSATIAAPGVRHTVMDRRRPKTQPVSLAWHAARPLVKPSVQWLRAGPNHLVVGVVLPQDHRAGRKLPVLMSPYGGPGHQAAIRSHNAWLEDQWLADQGFAVVVVDGRGTPGRGPAWERAICGDFATKVLNDQVAGLHGAAEQVGDLDLERVGIRGWSFGGYLSALAVLRRPDVFHAAVAGAPVTDWSLYDTYYTERYLGHPDRYPDAYRVSSLLEDAPKLSRPLLLIHGLADDNVVVAHTLTFSQRLLAAGRPHAVLPLSGVTHMASQEEVAENLLLLQVDFLRRALGLPATGA